MCWQWKCAIVTHCSPVSEVPSKFLWEMGAPTDARGGWLVC